jgi:prepilin-type N-terminal cleavage/methylation domain-containing protein
MRLAIDNRPFDRLTALSGVGGRSQIGFTLVELMVVITIVVVLLALLSPAMDRAIYRAELTVCGANMRGIAHGVTAYAAGEKRRYPARLAVTGKLGGWTPNTIAQEQWGLDERPLLRKFCSLQRTLYCPLNNAPEIESPTRSSTGGPTCGSGGSSSTARAACSSWAIPSSGPATASM